MKTSSEVQVQQEKMVDPMHILQTGMGFLQRTGYKDSAVYSNSEDTDLFLDKCKLSYIGGLLEMANNRLYPFWNYLEEGLKTGMPQNEIRTGLV